MTASDEQGFSDKDSSDQLFTEPWARAWGEALEESEAYRQAAVDWEGAVVLRQTRADGSSAGVYLDLWHGRCRDARTATDGDRDRARFVLAGSEEGWQRVLDGMSPVTALLRRKIRLEKGSLAEFMPYTRAAVEMLEAVRSVTARGEIESQDVDSDTVAGSGATTSEHHPDRTEDTSEHPSARTDSDAPGHPPARTFVTAGPGGLDLDHPAMELWAKAKTLGVWDPATIDFTRDTEDWERLSDRERDLLLRLSALFQAGEESVTLDLLPLMRVVAQEGRLEEEMYLTSFLWEEAKHVEVFARFFEAVGEAASDHARYHTPSYRRIFYEELPEALGALDDDPSPVSQARASVTYNLVVEGVLAETGYHTYHRVLTAHSILPAMQKVTGLLKQDESRHLAYGVHLLSRLVREHGEPVWSAIEARMDELLEPAIGIIHEAFQAYEPEGAPFGLQPDDFVDFATTQFQKRLGHVERARTG